MKFINSKTIRKIQNTIGKNPQCNEEVKKNANKQKTMLGLKESLRFQFLFQLV